MLSLLRNSQGAAAPWVKLAFPNRAVEKRGAELQRGEMGAAGREPDEHTSLVVDGRNSHRTLISAQVTFWVLTARTTV